MFLSLLLTGFLTLVELNCENMFDCKHDSLKDDMEWMPDGKRKWTPARYWRKLNHIGQEILSCQEDGVPDLVALVEVLADFINFAYSCVLRLSTYSSLTLKRCFLPVTGTVLVVPHDTKIDVTSVKRMN